MGFRCQWILDKYIPPNKKLLVEKNHLALPQFWHLWNVLVMQKKKMSRKNDNINFMKESVNSLDRIWSNYNKKRWLCLWTFELWREADAKWLTCIHIYIYILGPNTSYISLLMFHMNMSTNWYQCMHY